MSRHGDGAKGIAPCGHEGTYVTANLILCDRPGCDGRSRYGDLRDAKPVDHYTCRHPVRVKFNGTESCRDCGRVFRKP